MKTKYLLAVFVLAFMLKTEVSAAEYGLPHISPEDDFLATVEIMAKCVEAEAGNQGMEGKRLVAGVIISRTKDHDFPDTILEVIADPGQFSVYENGMLEDAEPTEETWRAVLMEIKEISYPSLLYFSAEGHLPYGTPWKKVGDHYFNKG